MEIGDEFIQTPADDRIAYAESLDAKHSVMVYHHLDTGLYSVVANGKLRHPNCDANAAIRALSFYLQSYMNTVHR